MLPPLLVLPEKISQQQTLAVTNTRSQALLVRIQNACVCVCFYFNILVAPKMHSSADRDITKRYVICVCTYDFTTRNFRIKKSFCFWEPRRKSALGILRELSGLWLLSGRKTIFKLDGKVSPEFRRYRGIPLERFESPPDKEFCLIL